MEGRRFALLHFAGGKASCSWLCFHRMNEWRRSAVGAKYLRKMSIYILWNHNMVSSRHIIVTSRKFMFERAIDRGIGTYLTTLTKIYSESAYCSISTIHQTYSQNASSNNTVR